MHIFAPVCPAKSVIAWVIIGLIAGWLAGTVSRGHRLFGCLANILLGLVGAILVLWIFMKLGILGGGIALTASPPRRASAVILMAIARLYFRGGGSN